MTRSVAYVRLIPPGAADTIHYRLHVPDDAGDQIFLRPKVNHRKFDWWYTQWAYAGVRDPNDNSEPPTAAYDDGQWGFTGGTSLVSGDLKSIPNLPITVMAETEASLTVIDEDDTIPGPPNVQYHHPTFANGGMTMGSACCCKVTCVEPPRHFAG
ncbi:MAG: hypothetical protein Ct9H300mP25_12640 [Acidobacteriota bacterium]|nr:MAG: hypothetical protein Ct9H300mP25_12640 [Acidobacteriota bacterium]